MNRRWGTKNHFLTIKFFARVPVHSNPTVRRNSDVYGFIRSSATTSTRPFGFIDPIAQGTSDRSLLSLVTLIVHPASRRLLHRVSAFSRRSNTERKVLHDTRLASVDFSHIATSVFFLLREAVNRTSGTPVAPSGFMAHKSAIDPRSPRLFSRSNREKRTFLQPEIPFAVRRTLASTPVLVAKPDIANRSFFSDPTLPSIAASKCCFALRSHQTENLRPLPGLGFKLSDGHDHERCPLRESLLSDKHSPTTPATRHDTRARSHNETNTHTRLRERPQTALRIPRACTLDLRL